MELAQLEIFEAAARHGSITRAAAELCRVPSNLTTRIRQLEDELGTALFIREKQRIRLSPAGAGFLDYAKRLLDLAQEAKRSIAPGTPGGRFVLGAMESVAAVRLPEVMARFHKRHPSVSLELFTGMSEPVLEGVLSGAYAAGFADIVDLHAALDGVRVYREPLVLIAEPQHAPIRTPHAIADRTLFTFNTACSYRRRLERWFDEAGARAARIVEISSYHGMLACVSGGSGVALLPLRVLESLRGAERVSVHALQGAHAIGETWLVWRRGLLHANVRALMDIVAEVTREEEGLPTVDAA